jgi:hypothetical protein
MVSMNMMKEWELLNSLKKEYLDKNNNKLNNYNNH